MAAMTHQRNQSVSGFRKSAMVENDLIVLNDAPRQDPGQKGPILILTYFPRSKERWWRHVTVSTVTNSPLVLIILNTFFSSFIFIFYHKVPLDHLIKMTQFQWPWPIFQGHRSILVAKFENFNFEYFENYLSYRLHIRHGKSWSNPKSNFIKISKVGQIQDGRHDTPKEINGNTVPGNR
jgi:hypothetical protein